MRSKKIIVSLLIMMLTLWLASAVSGADVTPAPTPSLLKQVRGQLLDAPLLRGEFQQSKQVEGFKNPLRSSGVFLQLRAQGLLWDTRKPFPASMVLTATTLRSEQGQSRYQLDSSKEPGLAAVNQLLFALLAGDLDVLAKEFEISGNVDAATWQLQLAPRTPALGKRFRRIALSGDRFVRAVELIEGNGDRTEISFSALAQTPQPSAQERARLGLATKATTLAH